MSGIDTRVYPSRIHSLLNHFFEEPIPVAEAGALQPWTLLSKTFAAIVIAAIVIFSNNCTGPPTIKEGYYQQGIELAMEGKFQSAQDHFELALAMDTLFVPAVGCLQIVAEVEEGHIPAEAAMLIFRGIDLGNQDLQEKKIACVSEAIAIAPESAHAYNERAIAHHTLGDYQAAVTDRRRAIELRPSFASAYFNKGLDCERLGEYREAVESYRTFIQIAPSRYVIYVQVARQRIQELNGVIMTQNQRT